MMNKRRTKQRHHVYAEENRNNKHLSLDLLEVVIRMCSMTKDIQKNEFKALMAFVILRYAKVNGHNANSLLEEIRQTIDK